MKINIKTEKLLVDIERERYKLHELARDNHRDMAELLEISRRLDKLILEYQKLSTPFKGGY